jgi:preprotein translocase subunit SecG
MKQNKFAKLMAILALLWIIVSIIWTWLLSIFGNNTNQQIELSPEQIQEIQDMINSQSWATQSSSWEIIDIENLIEEQNIETN